VKPYPSKTLVSIGVGVAAGGPTVAVATGVLTAVTAVGAAIAVGTEVGITESTAAGAVVASDSGSESDPPPQAMTIAKTTAPIELRIRDLCRFFGALPVLKFFPLTDGGRSKVVRVIVICGRPTSRCRDWMR
jgi:hypothetical protein